MTSKMNCLKIVSLSALCGAALSACTTAKAHLSEDFGYAARQAAVAQIADPDATYSHALAPGSNGSRASLAQERYRTGRVIAPSATASTIGTQAAAISLP
ncbi:MAG: hypothetical protein RJA87_313 [Pseudomonadota bacterium]